MSSGNGVDPIEILLVEANSGDVRLTQEVLKEGKIHNRLNVAHDGMEALAFLRRQGEHANAVRPDLILLDLNLPRKAGWEVLEEIKKDDGLKTIPVVVLTLFDTDRDLLQSYEQHANCYIQKPLDLSQFSKVVQTIQEYWLTIVKLPPKT